MNPTSRPGSGQKPRRVLLLGATGTIGEAVCKALVADGHEVVCLVRRNTGPTGLRSSEETARRLQGARIRFGDVADPTSLRQDGFCGEPFDVLVSCLASRTGTARDAWAIDYGAHLTALEVAQEAGVHHFVLLSAICVQKPVLAFQKAKLSFERALIASGMTYSIVRPTAFFKSLSGQLDRVRRGKPYLLVSDGQLTACKPISDRDLARFIAGCLTDPVRWNRILPVGGPGEAITPREQGEHMFRLLNRAPRFSRVPVSVLGLVRDVLRAAAIFVPALSDKAELAAIGYYYATESMLVLDPETGAYDASATPSTGKDTLFDHYARLVRDGAQDERGDHTVF